MAMSPYRSQDPLEQIWGALTGLGGQTGRGGDLLRSPDTDVVETEGEIRVLAEMPGFRRDDIELDLENNVLTISGEKQEQRSEGEEAGRYHLSERRYGRFSRSFILPRDVDSEQIRANFDNGVLTVTIPKSDRARRRRIEVEGTGGGSTGGGAGEIRGGRPSGEEVGRQERGQNRGEQRGEQRG